MTTVVAVRAGGRFALAADTQESTSDVRLPLDSHKLVKLGPGCWAAGAGPYSITEALRGHVRRGKPVRFTRTDEVADYFHDFWTLARERREIARDQQADYEGVARELAAAWLVISPHGAWDVDSGLAVSDVPRFASTGSGWRFAMGALASSHRVGGNARGLAKSAVCVAAGLCVFTGEPVDVVTVAEAP